MSAEQVQQAQQDQQKQQDQQQLISVLCVSGACLLVGAVVGVYIHRLQRRQLEMEAQLNKEMEATIECQDQQIHFLNEWRLKYSDISLQKELARGAEGIVFMGTLQDYEGPVAIKKSLPDPAAEESVAKPVWCEAEVAFMMSLEHPQLVKFLGAGEIPPGTPGGGLLFSVQEFLSGGSIDKALWGTPTESLTWENRVQWAYDIANGMAFIHSHGYAHRDLKSQNALYDKSTMRAKVADFGMARASNKTPETPNKRVIRWPSFGGHTASSTEFEPKVAASQPRNDYNSSGSAMMTAAVGTPQWMAPELCANEVHIAHLWEEVQHSPAGSKERARRVKTAQEYTAKHKQVEYGIAVDVYAFGIIMYELQSHQAPWLGMKLKDVYASVAAGKRPSVGEGDSLVPSPGWCELMHACWSDRPQDRPQFHAVLHNLSRIAEAEGSEGLVTDTKVAECSVNGDVNIEMEMDDLESNLESLVENERKVMNRKSTPRATVLC